MAPGAAQGVETYAAVTAAFAALSVALREWDEELGLKGPLLQVRRNSVLLFWTFVWWCAPFVQWRCRRRCEGGKDLGLAGPASQVRCSLLAVSLVSSGSPCQATAACGFCNWDGELGLIWTLLVSLPSDMLLMWC